ncbi:MAG: hypothetical protein A2033_05125 [Bacteroidetes bacterium GWA2_31_9]|nr:MAG: hypothetical protein A2033_05125 [Bacteroidetes bacterium GWA2_31_9]
MSEISNHKQNQIKALNEVFFAILNKKDAISVIKQNQTFIDKTTPSDIVTIVHELVKQNIPSKELKSGINKFLNILHKTIKYYPYKKPEENSFLDYCIRNNKELDKKLKATRVFVKQISDTNIDFQLITNLINSFKEILEYEKYYLIKENVLFPKIEETLNDFFCVKVMWSFHDDIRRNLKKIIQLLDSNPINLKLFNRLVGDVYFNMYAIIFRDERILFPVIENAISKEDLDSLFIPASEIGFPFYNQVNMVNNPILKKIDDSLIDLKTGSLTVEQILLIFNNLPVDITFVDENNQVKFFSSPKKRIFPRSTSIIGRNVNNCHPHESVHIVEKIIDNFRTGKQDVASFWINLKNEFILIKYFAIRDYKGIYKGVIEVTQEISGIKLLEGEKRLLDWED